MEVMSASIKTLVALRERWPAVSLALALTALSVLLPLAPAQAVGPTSVDVNPGSVAIDVGSSTTLTVTVAAGSSTSGLYAANLHLSFDGALLDVTNVSIGPLLQGNGQEDTAGGFFKNVTTDNSAGSVTVGVTLLNPAAPVTTPGTLVQVTVLCLAASTSAVSFSTLVLSDQAGSAITVTGTDGSVTCNSVATPTPTPVPSLSHWGLILVTMLLAGLLYLRLRRTGSQASS